MLEVSTHACGISHFGLAPSFGVSPHNTQESQLQGDNNYSARDFDFDSTKAVIGLPSFSCSACTLKCNMVIRYYSDC